MYYGESTNILNPLAGSSKPKFFLILSQWKMSLLRFRHPNSDEGIFYPLFGQNKFRLFQPQQMTPRMPSSRTSDGNHQRNTMREKETVAQVSLRRHFALKVAFSPQDSQPSDSIIPQSTGKPQWPARLRQWLLSPMTALDIRTSKFRTYWPALFTVHVITLNDVHIFCAHYIKCSTYCWIIIIIGFEWSTLVRNKNHSSLF